MTPVLGRSRRSVGAILAALALTLTLPASSIGAPHGYNTASDPYLEFTAAVTDPAAEIIALINSGEDPFVDDDFFQGIPDGIGVRPGPDGSGYVDVFVAHEQSHVPFGGKADLQDSSVSRVRVDIAEQSVTQLENQIISGVIPGGAGFLRFCSAFMAGPEHGFDNYTFLVNEESNETILSVPPGAVYGPDPAIAPNRQAGYSVWLDTETGEFDVISRAGRHNHENTVVIPGDWKKLAILSGDDTFVAPSSQLYLYTANDAEQMMADKGQLWAFQVTATNGTPLADPYDPLALDAANDYLEIMAGDEFSGRFIHVPTDVARGVTGEAPQTALENWSNANNVFQFVRVEDLAYDPDNPREVYFADTGTDRLQESGTTGRLFRGPLGTGVTSNGRIFKMVLNEKDPRIVDSFSIFADSADAASAFVNPDNLDVGHNSIMVQEDSLSANDIWQYSFAAETWTKVASVTGTGSSAESSGIARLEDTAFGAGWWALDVQGHQDLAAFTDPQPGGDPYIWVGPPSTATGPYVKRLEDGQLLLMYIPGS
ncbi:MAG: alkaline phosphatase PhoX [Chloroflexota bacterium]